MEGEVNSLERRKAKIGQSEGGPKHEFVTRRDVGCLCQFRLEFPKKGHGDGKASFGGESHTAFDAQQE